MLSVARFVAAIAVLLGLAACNVVDSDHALFGVADQADAPRLAQGVWADDGCTADALRAHAVPCAMRYEVSVSTVTPLIDRQALAKIDAGLAENKRPPENTRPPPLPYLLVGGHPTVVQVEVSDTDGRPAGYLFFALEPIAARPDGAVVEAEFWPVLCGPPLTAQERADLIQDARRAQDYVPVSPLTRAPFPGMDVQGHDCHAMDRSAVVNAARASRDIAERPLPPMKAGRQRIRWTSAGRPRS